jgi:CrcB protein
MEAARILEIRTAEKLMAPTKTQGCVLVGAIFLPAYQPQGFKEMRYLIVGLGGFIGANARFMLGEWAANTWGKAFPYGTFIINISGCFILGLFATLSQRLAWSDNGRLLVSMGFVGAYTTFSTFEYETFQLVSVRAYRLAVINTVGSVILGFIAAYLGVIAARLITRGRPL